MILCLDPGEKKAGVALFEDDGMLMRAWLATGDCWHATADSIPRDLPVGAARVTTVVIEKMQVYKEMPIPPGVLIQLSLMGGRVTGLFSTWAGAPVEYLPKTWKKQVPKKIHHGRIKKALSKGELSRVELPKDKKKAEDVWDAVGIGLYHLRKKRRNRDGEDR